MIDGVLLVDKPAGPTSQDVVTIVKRALGADKAGHAGTLDPFATGLLVVCLGKATKLAEYLTGDDKGYRAVVALGVATDTDDHTGKEIARADVSGVTREAVEAALASFRGEIRQVPPAFSAIQKDGQRMYDRARRGEAVEIEARTVFVRELVLEAFEPPRVTLALEVSKGTYIRAIARDLGAALGVGGHLEALRRTRAGAYRVDGALPLDAIRAKPDEAKRRVIRAEAVSLAMPAIVVGAEEARRVPHGILPRALAGAPPGLVRLLDEGGKLLAIVRVEAGKARFEKVLAS